MASVKRSLPAIFPLRLDLTVWALRRRRNNTIDRWDGHQYARIIIINNDPVKISVTQQDPASEPELSMYFHGEPDDTGQDMEGVMRLMQKVLGVELSMEPFYRLMKNDEYVGPLVRQFYGVKPPRFPTIFEALVNSIACQQVSLDVGIILLDRLAEKFGLMFDGATPSYSFPAPDGLANVPIEEIKKLGFSYQKARSIKELAAAITSGKIDLSKLEEMENQEAVDYLTALRGIGRWSAEYVLLRGLGRLDMFPGDDVGAQNNLRRLFNLDHKPGYSEIRELTARWRPYEGLIYFHLLLNKLHLNGVL
jgi:DNA-3-methyladenine glycosylase II